LDVLEWVKGAIVLVIGAFVLHVMIQSLAETYPAFGQYGWGLFAAYLAGAAVFLKYGLGKP